MGYRISAKAVMKHAAAQTWSGGNRRRHERTVIPAGPFGARLLGGIDVTLLNVSSRGILFESRARLLIGSPARLRLRTDRAKWTDLTGRVVRCEVTGLPDGRVRYETALHVDADCPVAELTALIGIPSEGQVALVESPGPIDPTLN